MDWIREVFYIPSSLLVAHSIHSIPQPYIPSHSEKVFEFFIHDFEIRHREQNGLTSSKSSITATSQYSILSPIPFSIWEERIRMNELSWTIEWPSIFNRIMIPYPFVIRYQWLGRLRRGHSMIQTIECSDRRFEWMKFDRRIGKTQWRDHPNKREYELTKWLLLKKEIWLEMISPQHESSLIPSLWYLLPYSHFHFHPIK